MLIQLNSPRKQSLSRSNALQKLIAKLCCCLPDRAFAANDIMKLVILATEIAQQRCWLYMQPLQDHWLMVCNGKQLRQQGQTINNPATSMLKAAIG